VPYPQVIAKKLDSLELDKRNVLALSETARFAEDLTKKMPDLIQGVQVTYFNEKIRLLVYPKTIREVAELLRRLAKHGFRIHNKHENPAAGIKTWELKNCLEVQATFDLADGAASSEQSEGKRCRFVKVGETRETREIVTPLYELQCDD
jgi:hypothetical protein